MLPSASAGSSLWHRALQFLTPRAVALAMGAAALVAVLALSHFDARTAAYFAPLAKVPIETRPYELTLADDDGDGDLDLWVSHEYIPLLHRYRNDGPGRLVRTNTWPSPTGMRIRLADFNEDGHPDLLLASYRDAQLLWRPGLGGGRWGEAQVLLSGLKSYDLWVGDLDGDHHLDLLLPNRADSVHLCYGDGRGGIAAHRAYAVGTHSLGVLAGDVDGDGDLDVLATSATIHSTGHYVRVLRNQGQRRFGQPTDIVVADSPQRLALADVDQDGDPDLLVTSFNTDVVNLCRNDGRGNFAVPRLLPTGRQPYALEVQDMDADGDLDLLVTSTLEHSVCLHRNDGHGAFAAPEVFEAGGAPYGLALGDVDGDGLTDMALANSADKTVTLLRGARPPLVWWPLPLAALLALGWAGFYRQRQRRRREREQRLELAADLHDELGGLLTLITLRAEALNEQAPSPHLASLIAESRAATTAVRDIIWSVNTAPDTVSTLVNRIRDLLAQTGEATGRAIGFELRPATLNQRALLRPNVRQHAYFICKEALTNVLRHAPDSPTVAVTLHLAPKQLRLTVRNTGAPVAAARIGQAGQGLRNMQHRAKQMGGTLTAGPDADGGWCVTLLAPAPLVR